LALLKGNPKEAPQITVVPLNDDAIVMWQRPAFAGYAALANGDADQVAAMVAKLREFGSVGVYVDALADRLDGLRLAALDRTAEAAELLWSAADSFASMGMPLLASQTRLEWVELTGRSADLIAGCLETFQRCGATPWVDRCRRLGRTLGLRLTSARRAGNLSNRETQVVHLVAEGLSNNQIAAQLFLSERTIETHLRNAYARLGISSRVALAKWVAENRDT
jgi:DNA-binding CsgD family transcriptional regulator